MIKRLLAALLLTQGAIAADATKSTDLAAAFGARPSILSISLSPDGASLAYVAAGTGSTSGLYTIDLAKDSEPKLALFSDGKPERISECLWVSNQRLACQIGQVVDNGRFLLPISRWVALDRDGSAVKLLSNPSSRYTPGYETWGGEIVDLLPEQDGAVLMERRYLPNANTGSHIGSADSGIGLDWIDTRTGESKRIETPGDSVRGYLTDHHGNVRIMALEPTKKSEHGLTGLLDYRYRKAGSDEWLKLAEFNQRDESGFQALHVDRDKNLVYGAKLLDGRMAIYSMTLDDARTEQLVCSRPDADIEGLIHGGRWTHFIGAYYKTDVMHTVFVEPAMQRIADMLARSLPKTPVINFFDSSAGEDKLLVLANAADDPGRYYLFDRGSRQLRPLLAERNALDGFSFSRTQSITYPASDGTPIRAQLTVPSGSEHAHGLPAIVLLRNNLETNDHWGAGWLAQYFAARGFAVLQATIRGTAGYDAHTSSQSPYKIWRTSVGDALDAGHWLVSQGIAEPSKLFVLGWSFGGYVALQAAVVEPALFKGVVAVGPVTDLMMLKEQWHWWSNYGLMEDYVPGGSEATDASPAHNAARIKVPVLIFHGSLDRLSSIKQSQRMADALNGAHVAHELVTFDGLGEDIDDSDARAQVLRKSDEFFRHVSGMTKP